MLLQIAVASILATGSLPALQAQEQTPKKWTQARTPDGHPDMQGMWARRGVAMAEANPPNAFAAAVKGSELMEFACAEGSQTLPNIFGFGFFPGQ
ncbi:MAG: hypothetical protein AUI91_15080 [Acidobacteria bacterium 13_1_40CM_3_56_11]|nr:MAG: hypothetical protein AUI91_15080 [Acidobacteria bacterium 13_1_40CM_3_56_11]